MAAVTPATNTEFYWIGVVQSAGRPTVSRLYPAGALPHLAGADPRLADAAVPHPADAVVPRRTSCSSISRET